MNGCSFLPDTTRSIIGLKPPFLIRSSSSEENTFYENELTVPMSSVEFWKMMMNPNIRIIMVGEDEYDYSCSDASTDKNNHGDNKEIFVYRRKEKQSMFIAAAATSSILVEIWTKTRLDDTIMILTQERISITAESSSLDITNIDIVKQLLNNDNDDDGDDDESSSIKMKTIYEWTLSKLSDKETKVHRKGIYQEHRSWLPPCLISHIIPLKAKEEDKKLIEIALPLVCYE